ncbi:MAG: signal peptidase I, partial [Flavobacteriaceae bacterium]
MTLTQWFLFFIAVQVVHFLGTWKLYQKAGRNAWEAAVPVYNAIVLMKIINRPWWYTILLFIPIINLIMFPVVWVETLRSFGKNKTADTVLGVITLGFYIYYVNYTQDVKYIADRDLKTKSASGEWVSSILFAVVVATIVHTYFIQPFTIPTSSLERTLLVGDFLFVSKMHYGARTPMTAVSFPMVHDTIPLAKVKSYTNKPQIPYFRFPAFQEIKRNDIVVFNWPVDTVPYFRYQGPKTYIKPIDKKSNYVKRAVGVPGDSLEVKDGRVYINGALNELPDRGKLQFLYRIQTQDPVRNIQFLRDRYGINEIFPATNDYRQFQAFLTDEAVEK